ncbi:Uma2 family endonuclease [Methylopila sp. Yamaguchi]|uniref:Uma2 family endonuclease n=1 Tax=Methylopila sp. Yamaguchi TaxID=1437817 RepID=UPI001FCF1A51|nr:Uma2 family endonuclease [Methylopila sp. Yamaguchi]
MVNLVASLHGQLRGKPCETTTDAIALKIPAGNVRRPDVTVECGQPLLKDTTSAEPRLVVEVLSPSTMNFDRVRKLDEYKSGPSLRYILLVDTEKPQMTLLRLDAAPLRDAGRNAGSARDRAPARGPRPIRRAAARRLIARRQPWSASESAGASARSSMP